MNPIFFGHFLRYSSEHGNMLPVYSAILVTSYLQLQLSFLQDSTPVLCFCGNLLHILLMLVSIEFNNRFMLLTRCRKCIYIYSLDIVCLYSAPFIYVVTIYFILHHYVCLPNSQVLLAALVHFSCIFIGQFRFRCFSIIPKFRVSHFCSDICSLWFQWCKIGFVQLWQSGSHFWLLVWTYYMYRLQVMSGN